MSWTPRSKYEVAPGLFIGSEMEDLNKESRALMKRLVDGEQSVMPRIMEISRRREELMMSKRSREMRRQVEQRAKSWR